MTRPFPFAFATFVIAFMAIGAAPAIAADPAPDANETVLHLTQRAERIVPRAQVHAELRIEVTGANPRLVQGEMNKRMSAALEKAKGVAGVKPETSGYSIYQVSPPTPTGAQNAKNMQWRAEQSLDLSGKDFTALLGLAGDLQSDGMLMSDLRFDLAPDTARALQDSLTGEALAAVKDRARRIADDMGMRVDRFRTLTAGNVQGQDTPQPRVMAMMAPREASASASNPPASAPGEATVWLIVNAEVALGPVKQP